MAKPQSIKIEPWTDFPKQPYTLFTDDFIHDKLFTLKVNSKGDKSTVNVKANVNTDKGTPTLTDQVKFWFPVYGGHSVYTKVKSNNYIKLHYDHGIFEQWNSKWNLYASLNSNKALQNISVRLGASNNSQNCHSDNRLKVDLGAEGKQNLTWYNRTIVKHDKFTFGLMAAYGITHNVLVKNNLLFGYKVNDTTNASLRIENHGYRKDNFDWAYLAGYFDNVKLDVVSKYQDNVQYGLEGVFKLRGKAPLDQALLVVKHHNIQRNHTAKVKISSKFHVSASYKYPGFFFTNIATATIGIHGQNLHNEKRAFKFGAQIEFNV